ncbi:peptidylprolyl isomerase [Candidatus Poriferisodalis sp.]|uniref:peptidylprolyl isomerase n=1 Tax=Candidatus Poriferisodalis sp. TaxID=3101277 RepID=UPI003B017ED4
MRAVAEAERSKKRSSATRKVITIALVVAAVLVALFLWSTFTGDDTDGMESSSGDAAVDTADAGEGDESDSEPTPGTDDAGSAARDQRADAAADTNPEECPAGDGSDGPVSQFDAPPPLCIDPETMYAARFETSMGDFTMVLDPSLDLASVNNLVVLGRWGAFDDTLFHRVIADFVIQGGDVQLQRGTGGPGYMFTGGFPDDDWYRIGSVAMANSSSSPATNGSQFFVITGENGAALPPLYSPLGHVVDGMEVVMAIEGVETDAADAPIDDVVVRTVKITEATSAQIDAYTDARS